MADDESERKWADLREAQRIWDVVKARKAFHLCPVIYQFADKPLLYTLEVDGRVLIAWPTIDTKRLARRMDFRTIEKHGVTLPSLGPFARSGSTPPSKLVPIWLDDTVDAVPLFAIRGSTGDDTALLLADAIREDVRANRGQTRRIGLTPPETNTRRTQDARVVSARRLQFDLQTAARKRRRAD